MKQFKVKASAQQSGFTLIELIVVIVILGIMAATAIPKFVDMGSEARVAKMQAAAGALKAAAAMEFSKTLAATGTGTYPSVAGIAESAGLTDDYQYSSANGVGTVTPDTTHTACAVTYTAATGAVVSTAVTTANC